MRYNFLAAGYSIVDELLNRASSTSLRIGHDLIKASAFEIWTGVGKTGTKLTLTTDYTLTDLDADATTDVGTNIYTKVSIVNGAYLNTNLYLTYTTVGDLDSIENIMEISNGITVVTGNYTILGTDKKIVVNTASAISLTITEGLSLYKDIEIQRIVASTNAITLLRSGSETIDGATSFITHGALTASTLNPEVVRITKTSSTTWKWVAGVVMANIGTGITRKNPSGFHVAYYTGTTPATAGTAINFDTGIAQAKVVDIQGSYITGPGVLIPFYYLDEALSRTYKVNGFVTNIGYYYLYADTSCTVGLSRPFKCNIRYID